MEANFSRKNTIMILEAYYKRYENLDTKITIDVNKGCCGLHEEECAEVSINMTSNVPVLGTNINIERNVSKNQVKKAFQTILEEEGYEVLEIYYDTSLKKEWVGYYKSEHQETTAVFNGIHVNMKKMSKEKVKK